MSGCAAVLAAVFCAIGAAAPVRAADALKWSGLPELPPAPGRDIQPGVAGPYAGVHNDALIVAGGANFPEALPWRGGKKIWHDDALVLERAAGGYEWRTGFKLPRPLAYGVSVNTPDGVLCIGGCDAERCYSDVFLLKWDGQAGKLSAESLPPLPCPLAFMAGAMIGDTVYVAGGQEVVKDGSATKDFFAFDLAGKEWRELEPWPGPARVVPVVAAQSDGASDCFYLFSGRNTAPGKDTNVLTDAYKYDPKRGAWKKLGDIVPPGETNAAAVQAGTAVASGARHIFVFGGDDGKIFTELESLARRIGNLPDGAAKEALKKRQQATLDNHPGFSDAVLSYNTVTDAWSRAGKLPGGSQVTTTALKWGDAIVIPSGEIRPGVRTASVRLAEGDIQPRFGTVNYGVLVVYLAALVCMGFYFSRREKSTNDFFKAGGRIPWWAAGLSIFGTQLSAITFIAIPAKTYATDWRYFMLNMSIVIVAPFIVFLYLPFYRKLDVTTAYEYLEKRFNVATRLIGSAMFVLLQLGRIGVVLFLPSIALSVVTGMDVRTCILVMGVLSIIYTVLGGIEAVIWTDVLQVFVLLGGAIVSLAMIVARVDGGFGGVMALARESDKFFMFDTRFSFVAPTLWVVLLGGVSANLISYGSDQAVIQRYLTTRDQRAAARGIWTNAVLCIPASMLFFFVGTALYALHKTHPAEANPLIGQADAVFPWYIVANLPTGLAGLLIAGVFAASMSSLDSSMNSVATAVTTDWYRRFRPRAADHRCLNLARWVTVVVGAAGTVLALLMAQWNVKSLWDQFSQIIGLFAGGLGGLFLLGILSRRANGIGAIAGLLASGVIQYIVKVRTPIYLLLYAFTGLMSCIIIGYVVSILTGGPRKDTAGLTIGSIDRDTAG